MAEIVLFHHVCGLTPGVRALADQLTEAGHLVHLPDLFNGTTFASLDEGVAHAQEIGFGELLERGVAAGQDLPAEVVHIGISLGVMPAQRLAQTRPGALGAILLEACVPASEFAPAPDGNTDDGGGWPTTLPVQIHGMDQDPFFAGDGDVDAARAIVEQVGPEVGELFTYPGDRHLFCDSSLSSHDPEATSALTARVLDFLDRLDRG